jgi:acetyl esterase/lipase
MTSFKASAIQCLLRKRHLFKGKFKQAGIEQSREAVLAFRDECEKGGERFGKLPPGIKVVPEVIMGIYTELLIPENAADDKLLFYVHGGGYVSGSCNDHRAIVSKLTHKSGITTFLYEYGLAPENPYPAAIDDSINMYQQILEKGYTPGNIVIAGESAGGGLALALLLALKDKGIPLPKSAVVISPWTDLACTSESYTTKNKASLAPPDSWNVFSHYYVGKHDVRCPYISPLHGDLSGLPPLLINAGDADELFDDALLFFKKAESSGVDVKFTRGEELVHCYPLMAPMFREATEAMDEIVAFIGLKLGLLINFNEALIKNGITRIVNNL